MALQMTLNITVNGKSPAWIKYIMASNPYSDSLHQRYAVVFPRQMGDYLAFWVYSKSNHVYYLDVHWIFPGSVFE